MKIYQSKKSSIEIEVKALIKECADIVDGSYLTTEDANKIIEKCARILDKCNELRLSRDAWRNKYERLKEKL